MTSKPTLKIGVDCRLAGQRHAGIGRYIENLIVHLPRAAAQSLSRQQPTSNQTPSEKSSQVNLVYFFHDQEQARPILNQLKSANYQKKSSVQLDTVWAPIRHYTWQEQWQWPRLLKKQQLDLLHVPHFNIPLFLSAVPLIVTIHDLLWHQQIGPAVTTLSPVKYYFKYLAYRLVTSQAIKQARQILVPATAVAGTIQDFFPNTQHKIKVTPEGISQSFSKVYQQSSSAQIKSNQAKSDFQAQQLIYVGSLYPHKNVKLILQLLTQQPQLRLTVVSARDVFVKRFLQEVRALKLDSQVDYTGYLSDAELIKQLQTSLALIQPSLSEGFGLTGVEAMACGTPVLASDIAVFHEIYQQAPIYFDPHSTQSLHSAIKQVQQSQQRQKCIKQGYQVVKNYSWQKTAQQTWHSYQQVIYEEY